MVNLIHQSTGLKKLRFTSLFQAGYLIVNGKKKEVVNK